MKKGWIVGGVVIAAVAAVVAGKMMKPKEFAQAVALPMVETTQPKVGNIELSTGLIGKVEPADVVYVYPKSSGDVTAVNVKAGDVIKAGTVLCTIDTKQVENAKTSLASAELSLKQAKEELSRNQILYSNDGISAQQYQQYQDAVSSAQIQYDSAKFSYETQLSYSQVTSPIGGMVELCSVEQFDTVSQSNLICVVSGQGGRVVNFSTTERIRDYLKEGDAVRIEKGGTEYAGTIQEVSTMADTATGLYQIKASIDDENSISTGSEVKVYVISESAENVMTIPVDAVYYDNGKPYAYIEKDDVLVKTYLETGIYDSTTIEVKSGLGQEDHVVTTWSSELYDGAQIRTKDTQTKDTANQDTPTTGNPQQ